MPHHSWRMSPTPAANPTMVRTERMARLLRSPLLPIKQIATLVGWADADFAARQCRRGLGVTPTTYRQFVCTSDSAERLGIDERTV